MPSAERPATYPTLRERVCAVLLAAGFADRQDTLPTYSSRGTFDLTAGAVVRVEAVWWDRTEGERRELFASFTVALEGDGFVVARDGDVLLVSVPEKRSDEE